MNDFPKLNFCGYRTTILSLMRNQVRGKLRQTHGSHHFYCARSTPEDIKIHFQEPHYECHNCDFYTYSKFLFVTHKCRTRSIQNSAIKMEGLLYVRKIRRIHCALCSYKTIWNCQLKVHITAKHTAPEQIHWLHCEYCAYKGKQISNLRSHIISQHTSPEHIRWFQCENCEYKTKRNSHLTQHVRLKHTAAGQTCWLQCEHCEFTTKLKHSLKRHQISKHVANEIIWLQCERCEYRTKHNKDLRKHVTLQHTVPEDTM